MLNQMFTYVLIYVRMPKIIFFDLLYKVIDGSMVSYMFLKNET